MAGVESGYGRGYVSQITGNILSLGAKRGEAELPALVLPSVKNGPVLFDEKEIKQYEARLLDFKKRPKSLKKDYRPKDLAGTNKNLAYFKYHQKQRYLAQKQNLKEFMQAWISTQNSFKPFQEARAYLEKQKKVYGKEAIFQKEVNTHFIALIGGRKNSFNYRKTWPKKVAKVMQKTGLVELCHEMHFQRENFKKAWIKKF